MVCSGWLRKSPPEKKLKRYVSTGRGTVGRAAAVRAPARRVGSSTNPALLFLDPSLGRRAPDRVRSTAHPDVHSAAKLSPSILQTASLAGLVAC